MLSDVEPRHLAEALGTAPVVCVRNRYGLDRPNPGTDELLLTYGEQGIAFVPFSVVADEGGEHSPAGEEPDEVLAVARAYGATPAQIRIA